MVLEQELRRRRVAGARGRVERRVAPAQVRAAPVLGHDDVVRDGAVGARRRRGRQERARRGGLAVRDGELERRAAPGRVRVVARAGREARLRAGGEAPPAAEQQGRVARRLVEARVDVRHRPQRVAQRGRVAAPHRPRQAPRLEREHRRHGGRRRRRRRGRRGGAPAVQGPQERPERLLPEPRLLDRLRREVERPAVARHERPAQVLDGQRRARGRLAPPRRRLVARPELARVRQRELAHARRRRREGAAALLRPPQRARVAPRQRDVARARARHAEPAPPRGRRDVVRRHLPEVAALADQARHEGQQRVVVGGGGRRARPGARRRAGAVPRRRRRRGRRRGRRGRRRGPGIRRRRPRRPGAVAPPRRRRRRDGRVPELLHRPRERPLLREEPLVRPAQVRELLVVAPRQRRPRVERGRRVAQVAVGLLPPQLLVLGAEPRDLLGEARVRLARAEARRLAPRRHRRRPAQPRPSDRRPATQPRLVRSRLQSITGPHARSPARAIACVVGPSDASSV